MPSSTKDFTQAIDKLAVGLVKFMEHVKGGETECN